MDAFTLIISLILVTGTVALVLYPLWRPTTVFQADQSGQTLAEYQARYQAALAAIKDLMFDHEMGKVSNEDYEPLLNGAKLEAAALRQQLDRLSNGVTRVDAEIEALVAQMRRDRLEVNHAWLPEIDAEIEQLQHAVAKVCPTCGRTVQADDTFCAKCGANLVKARMQERAS